MIVIIPDLLVLLYHSTFSIAKDMQHVLFLLLPFVLQYF